MILVPKTTGRTDFKDSYENERAVSESAKEPVTNGKR